MKEATIFNIQRFSIHDGDGIRTTIFFKSCPLRCKWCSNPESQEKNIQILYDKSKCVLCQTCVKTCPQKAISLKDDRIVVNNSLCNGCLDCVNVCPQNALTSEGEKMTVQKVKEICLKDKDFYEESNGGVTFSGGEALVQADFVKELVLELKKENINLAVETTGYINKEVFQSVIVLFDQIFFDIKHYDRDKHKEFTGVYNDLILENFKYVIDKKLNVLPRIPVIPNYNDSLKDAENFANLFLEFGIKKVQLLPFHQFGEKKYELLNRSYYYKNKKSLHPEDLIDYQNVFLDKGIDCFF